MPSNKLLVILLMLWWPVVQGKSKLPELVTKRNINDIRFISQDGKLTYFQKQSGELILSIRHELKEIIKGPVGVQYNIVASPVRKGMLITRNDHYHTFLSLIAPLKIYATSYGDTALTLMGEGRNPKLHLEDKWLSYYHPYQRVIILQMVNAPKIRFTIPINRGGRPYFFPFVVMVNSNRVIFTDIGPKGFPQIVSYRGNINKREVLLRVPSMHRKIELCTIKEQIIVGIFGLENRTPYSSIYPLPIDNLDKIKKDIFYQSAEKDIGNMVCLDEGLIYFIKAVANKQEVAQLNVTSKKITIVSNVSHATQVVYMDGRVLLPYQGKYFVLRGESDITKDEYLEKR